MIHGEVGILRRALGCVTILEVAGGWSRTWSLKVCVVRKRSCEKQGDFLLKASHLLQLILLEVQVVKDDVLDVVRPLLSEA